MLGVRLAASPLPGRRTPPARTPVAQVHGSGPRAPSGEWKSVAWDPRCAQCVLGRPLRWQFCFHGSFRNRDVLMQTRCLAGPRGRTSGPHPCTALRAPLPGCLAPPLQNGGDGDHPRGTGSSKGLSRSSYAPLGISRSGRTSLKCTGRGTRGAPSVQRLPAAQVVTPWSRGQGGLHPCQGSSRLVRRCSVAFPESLRFAHRPPQTGPTGGLFPAPKHRVHVPCGDSPGRPRLLVSRGNAPRTPADAPHPATAALPRASVHGCGVRVRLCPFGGSDDEGLRGTET